MFSLFLVLLPVLVLCSVIFPNGSSFSEGELCQNKNPNGESQGRCISAYECKWALNQIQQRIHVDFCCFKGKTPIVCCPQNQIRDKNNPFGPVLEIVPNRKPNPIINILMETATEKEFNEPENAVSSKIEGPGQLSQSKCDEYYPSGGFHTVAVGGEESLAKEFPHMAILGFGSETEKQWKCGGSLISLQHVLTAAHCLSSRELGDVRYVRLGDLDIKNETDDAEPQDFTVKRAIQHPDFDSTTVKNDIAILELDRPVKLTDYVKPACLHLGSEIKSEEEIQATGWGVTEYSGEPSSHLIKVGLKLIGNNDCRQQYKRNGARGDIREDMQVCARSARDDKIMDTCQGDSGGPLQMTVWRYPKHYSIVGITSFGKACGITNSAGVYTRVSFYLPWIEPIVFRS